MKRHKDMTYENIYFIGIGGIGMSAIARYYNFKGYAVSGYDRTPSDLTRELEKEGIRIHYTDDTSYIPEDAATNQMVCLRFSFGTAHCMVEFTAFPAVPSAVFNGAAGPRRNYHRNNSRR